MAGKEKKGFKMPSAFSILFLIIFAIGIITWFIPEVESASLSQMIMAAPKGFADAIDVCVFVLCIGGFLGVVAKTGALDVGIATIVKKMKGNELMLIPVLMLVFSLGGTSYGMCEETMAFYVLVVGTMMAAGFDAMVGAAIILLGAGVGCLGSTVNPFAVGAAIDALQGAHPDIVVNQALVIGLGAILWLVTLVISIVYVYNYAKKVKAGGKSILSSSELAASQAEYSKGVENNVEMTGSQKVALTLFALSFVIMIISLIPWWSFGITMPEITGILVGLPFGDWYFQELQAWFTIMAIVVGIVSKMEEGEIVSSYMAGAADMISVVMVIAVSRGISVLMGETGLDAFVLENASNLLSGVNGGLFAVCAFFVYIGISFLIPSTSGCAAATMPTFGALTHSIGLSPEVMIAIFCAAIGIVNLITPTSAVVMGGTALSKIEYPTWVKFVTKLVVILTIVCLVILSAAMMIL